MSDFYPASVAASPSSVATKARSSRAAPKTDEQLLAAAEKRTGLLRSRVIANRDRQRMELVDELYKKYSVAPVEGDMSESRRLALLRSKLGL